MNNRAMNLLGRYTYTPQLYPCSLHHSFLARTAAKNGNNGDEADKSRGEWGDYLDLLVDLFNACTCRIQKGPFIEFSGAGSGGKKVRDGAGNPVFKGRISIIGRRGVKWQEEGG